MAEFTPTMFLVKMLPARNQAKLNVFVTKSMALLAIMVVDIQREYRFYSESGNTPSKKHGHTP
ncbi:hypothetical protein, partial [Fibrobacter sp.]|uniref:hypothetical protein n=1 Tax=Fibrobacter sp. TaxID=35828 RepID=UPI0025C158A1